MKISIPGCHFPVICKKGVNKAGETLIYVFNYSKDTSFVNLKEYLDDTLSTDTLLTCLFTGERISAMEQITLFPWDVRIYIYK